MTKTLTTSDLSQFIGSETVYRHPLHRHMVYSEGVQYVAETGGAYWLIDEIALAQRYEPKVAAEEFQFWKLVVRPDNTATLTCDDGNGTIVLSKEVQFTDFPLPEITFYFTNKTLYLPSEH